MNAKDLIERMENLSKITDFDERVKEDDKFLSYLEGVIHTEHDDYNRMFLVSLFFTLQSRLVIKGQFKELSKKFDDLQPTINNILGRVGQLEKRFDDLDKGK